MKAPDKIYVAESLIKTPYGNEWSPTPYISRESTEYIRKEALLEWAKEKYEEYDRRIAGFPDDGAYWGQRNAFRQMIDKLNSI
jgi:hypothetical protein